MGYAWKLKLGITAGIIAISLSVIIPEITSLPIKTPNAASIKALEGIRDWRMVKWYSIPLLALIFYIYTKEIYKARKNGKWDAVIGGFTLLGVDLFNETWNGWIYVLTNRAALWVDGGDTCFRIFIGWNYEIMFLFALAGVIFYYMCPMDQGYMIFKVVPNRYCLAALLAVIGMMTECILNQAGLLLWEYSFWNRSLWGCWLLVLYYSYFFIIPIWVLELKSNASRVKAVLFLYALSLAMNIFAFGFMGWNY